MHPHPVGGQCERSGATHRSGADYDDIGVEFVGVHGYVVPFGHFSSWLGSDLARGRDSGLGLHAIWGSHLCGVVFELPGSFLPAERAAEQ